MRKPVSLLLIALILFNVLGYYGVFIGLRYKNIQNIIDRADQQAYSTGETITIKIPLHAPYSFDKDYERVDGEVELKGEFYRLIKQKIAQDTAYIVCVKDVNSKALSNTLTEFVKTFTDKHSTPGSKLLKNFIKDYIAASTVIEHTNHGWIKKESYTANLIIYRFSPTADITQPPEA